MTPTKSKRVLFDQCDHYSMPKLRELLLDQFAQDFDAMAQQAGVEDNKGLLSFLSMKYLALLRTSEAMASASAEIDSAPASAATFQRWARISPWSTREAALLLGGLDPKRVKATQASFENLSESNPQAEQIVDVLDIFKRAGHSHIDPANVLSWADGLKIEVPNDLRQALTDIWGRETAPVQSEEKSLGPRERNNLHRVIAGLAVEARIDLRGEKAAGPIAAAGKRFGGPDEKTIRKLVAQIREQILPSDWRLD